MGAKILLQLKYKTNNQYKSAATSSTIGRSLPKPVTLVVTTVVK